MIGALLGGIGSIAGAFMGADASSEANETNWKINLLNYYQRERERRQAIQQYRENRADTHLGATDPLGNRTHFVEGVGWVTDTTPESKELLDLQRDEQLNVLRRDLPLRREQLEKNFARQRDEDYYAQGFLDELRNIRKEDPAQVEGELLAVLTRGINEAHDEASSPLLRTALRTGASNIDKIVEGVAQSRSDALTRAFQDAKLRARDIVDTNFNNRRQNAATLYNMFAERAARMPDVSYSPQNPTTGAANNLSQFASLNANAGSELARAFALKGGELDYVQPDYGMANAVSSAGQVLGSIGNSLQSRSAYDQSLDDAFTFYGLNRRRRSNQGAF